MLLVLHLLNVLAHPSHALPFSSYSADNGTSVSTCDTGNQNRTVYDIFWSCISTIFACTWISIHPNIPFPDQSPFAQRVQLFIVALFLPEFVVLWALRQWLSARRLALNYKAYGWTMTHGFFAIMGGLDATEDDEKSEISSEFLGRLTDITDQRCRIFFQHKEQDCPGKWIFIEEARIQDQSKGDALSKLLVIIQVTWFILQFFARVVQNLLITEIEIVTLGYAILNVVIYACWWYKPLDVRYTIKISERRPDSTPCPWCTPDGSPYWVIRESPLVFEHEHSDSMSCDSTEVSLRHSITPANRDPACTSPTQTHYTGVSRTIRTSQSSPANVGDISQLRRVSLRLTPENRSHVSTQAQKRTGCASVWGRLWTKTLTVVLVCIRFISRIFQTLVFIMRDEPGYITYRESHHKWRYPVTLIGCFFGMVFGGIHCMAWRFHFPSPAEKILWQTSSVVVTCLPLFAFVDFCLFTAYSGLPEALEALVNMLILAVYPLFVLYVAARLVLLTQMFVLLRAPEEGTLQTVPWTTFIPHL